MYVVEIDITTDLMVIIERVLNASTILMIRKFLCNNPYPLSFSLRHMSNIRKRNVFKIRDETCTQSSLIKTIHWKCRKKCENNIYVVSTPFAPGNQKTRRIYDTMHMSCCFVLFEYLHVSTTKLL